MLVVDLPAHRSETPSPAVRLEDERGGLRVDDNLHARLDLNVVAGVKLPLSVERSHGKPVLAILWCTEGELGVVGGGVAPLLPREAAVVGNPELHFLEPRTLGWVDVERDLERSVLVVDRLELGRAPRRWRSGQRGRGETEGQDQAQPDARQSRPPPLNHVLPPRTAIPLRLAASPGPAPVDAPSLFQAN